MPKTQAFLVHAKPPARWKVRQWARKKRTKIAQVFEKNTPFYPTDHCGVLRINTDDLLPKYIGLSIKKEGERVGFSRSYRASIDRMEGLTVEVAPIEEQRKAVAQVEQY